MYGGEHYLSFGEPYAGDIKVYAEGKGTVCSWSI